MKLRSLNSPAFFTWSMLQERHYSVAELATVLNVSTDTVTRELEKHRDLYDRCPVFTNKRRGKRIYRTIRIPESVAKELYRRLLGANKRAA